MSQTKAQLIDNLVQPITGALGSAAAPTFSFTADLNTGLFSPGADAIALATAGTNRLHITSAGLVGIGTTSPGAELEVSSTDNVTDILIAEGSSPSSHRIRNVGSILRIDADVSNTGANSAILIAVDGSERARIDNSGRLLVGTSSARSGFFSGNIATALQIEGGATSTCSFSITRNAADADSSKLVLAHARGTANQILTNNDAIGEISWQGADGAKLLQAASITALVDGTPGSDDMPGALVFSTTADGASSPTERMRIRANGEVLATQSAANPANYVATATSGSYAGVQIAMNCYRAANSAYNFLVGWSANFSDVEFNLRGDGTGLCDGSWTGGGADYAEYFEWSDGNLDEEDRRGIAVVLDGEKIRPAEDGEDPIGVISGNPSVVGDAAWNKWNGKYLRDDYGTYIQEDYEVEDEDGNTVTQQRRKLNPSYDPDAEYIPREQRPEWDCVGLMGKLRIRKGQPTGSRWIKMRDISDSVEEWLVR